MTSKISCIKLIRQDIRQRGWLAALISVTLFLAMPVYAMIYIDSFLGSSTVMTAAEAGGVATADNMSYILEELCARFPGLLNGYTGNWNFMSAVIVIFAMLSAMSGFSFLHSKDKMDFYHSLSVRREQWFLSEYVSGILIFIVPYVIYSGLTIAAGGINGIMTVQLAADSALAAAGGMFAFLVIYHACLLAVMLTGQNVTGFLASGVIIVYPTLVFSLFVILKSTFFASYYEEGGRLIGQIADLLSPVGIFISLISSTGTGELRAAVFAGAVVISALFLVGAFLLYKIYPSEAAGCPLSFSRTAPAFKVLICIPAALFSGIAVKELMSSPGTKWILAVSFLAAVILCMVIEFIYRRDLRMLFAGWRSSLISLGGVALILCIFQFDLLGYDTYQPKQDKVESMGFSPNSFWNYFEYAETSEGYEMLNGGGVQTENTDAFYRLARTGIKNLEKGLTPETVDRSSSDSEIGKNYINVTFCYKLESGKKVYRRYCIERGEAMSALEDACQNEEYRKALFPIFGIEHSDVRSIQLRDIYGISEDMNLDEQQREKLLQAYEKDVLAADIKTLAEEKPIGELLLTIPDKSMVAVGGETYGNSGDFADAVHRTAADGVVTVGSFYLYESYVNTISCIEEYGCVVRTEIKPEDVRSVTLYLSQESELTEEIFSALSDNVEQIYYDEVTTEVRVEDQEDIRTVLEYLEVADGGILGGGNLGNYADIQFVDGMSAYSYAVR